MQMGIGPVRALSKAIHFVANARLFQSACKRTTVLDGTYVIGWPGNGINCPNLAREIRLLSFRLKAVFWTSAMALSIAVSPQNRRFQKNPDRKYVSLRKLCQCHRTWIRRAPCQNCFPRITDRFIRFGLMNIFLYNNSFLV